MNPIEPIQDPQAGTLVPPRPNLGPEPWPEGRGSVTWPATGLFVLALVALFLLLRIRRPRAKRISPMTTIDESAAVELSSREMLTSTSKQLREAFVQTFGPSWRSKTTEELSHDSALLGRLDPEEFERMVAILKLADRVKFADADPGSAEDWEAWGSAIAVRLAKAPEVKPGTAGK